MRVALLIVLASAGCLDSFGPEVGPPLRPACTGTDSDPGTRVHFEAEIRTVVIARVCARCHTPIGATPIGVQIGGLDLSSATSLRAGGVESGSDIVIPGDPCASVLVQKLGAAPPFGARMPLDGPPYLEARELRLISDWIAEGAVDE